MRDWVEFTDKLNAREKQHVKDMWWRAGAILNLILAAIVGVWGTKVLGEISTRLLTAHELKEIGWVLVCGATVYLIWTILKFLE